MNKSLLLLIALFMTVTSLCTTCGNRCRENNLIQKDLDYSLGDTNAPNGILDYFYEYLLAPSNIDDLISFMKEKSIQDTNFRWSFYYSIQFLQKNYNCLKMEKTKSNDVEIVTIKNNDKIVAEEICSYNCIPLGYLNTIAATDVWGNKFYSDSINTVISENLIQFVKKRKEYLLKIASEKNLNIKRKRAIFEYKDKKLVNLISGDTLAIENNDYYRDICFYFDSLSTQNNLSRIAVIFWDLTYE
ncbi:MAG: hypothetical protein J6N56_00530 [Bacteroidales bacterium]|nr:hypothetical protein [Bacteroidales bacterium]